MGIMQDLWQTSRAGGGEGWFGMQPKMSGIQKSEMGGFGEEPTHKYIDPETSGMQIRGILGALSKINLRRDLQEESEAGYWKGGEYGAVNYGDTEKELPNYYQRGGGDTDDVIDAYSKYYKSPKNIMDLIMGALGGGRGDMPQQWMKEFGQQEE